MAQSEEVYTLTGEQLTETCVRFSMIMGWINGPGSEEWYRMLLGYGKAEGFHRSLTSARREAVARAAEGITTSVDVLKKLEAGDAG